MGFSSKFSLAIHLSKICIGIWKINKKKTSLSIPHPSNSRNCVVIFLCYKFSCFIFLVFCRWFFLVMIYWHFHLRLHKCFNANAGSDLLVFPVFFRFFFFSHFSCVCMCSCSLSCNTKILPRPQNRVSANQNAKRKTNKETQMLAGESEHKSKVATCTAALLISALFSPVFEHWNINISIKYHLKKFYRKYDN